MKKKRLSMMYVLCMLAFNAIAAPASVSGNDVALKFDPANYVEKTIEFPNGKTVKYRAYEHIYYVTNVEDSTYQILNYFVPQSAYANNSHTPIFFRTYVGGYMASPAGEPNETDASGRALLEGYVVCIPGSRGSNSIVERKKGKIVYTGKAPAGLVDLKAAVRYLRFNDALMPGDAEKIITDGTSAGGAMSSLLGATGNNPAYDFYLKSMGAASARDDVFASVCYCPITDLNHADMAYEWLYSCTNDSIRKISDEQKIISGELSAAFPEYLNGLNLRKADGSQITIDNYLDYIKTFLIKSAQRAKDEGCDLPTNAGIKLNQPKMMKFGGTVPTGQRPPKLDSLKPDNGMPMNIPLRGEMRGGGIGTGDFVMDIDMKEYLNYVATTQALKNPPAFDQLGVTKESKASPENSVFGDAKGNPSNFTQYSFTKNKDLGKAKMDVSVQERVRIMNPMNFIGDGESTTAPNWFIRHGARDRDTSFAISVNLATKLMNCGKNVDFALPWNRPHSGDYNLDDLFGWIASIVK